MRASIIFGPSSSEEDLQPFNEGESISWLSGLPRKREDVDAIILFGGDGTIHRHLPRLMELQLPMLVVPKGSGNDLARALNLRRLKDSIVAWQKFVSGAGDVRLIDVGTIRSGALNESSVREHFFCTVAGVGIDGEVARRANSLPRWLRGNGGYLFTLLPTIFKFAAFPVKIVPHESDRSISEPAFRPTILAAFANVPTFGGGMKIAPHARLDDGKLDVCVIQDIDTFKLFCVFPTIYFGRHLAVKEVEYSKVTSLRIETERPFPVYADGEYVCQTPIEVSLRRGVLPVIVPEEVSIA